jgi:hypothetical protein
MESLCELSERPEKYFLVTKKEQSYKLSMRERSTGTCTVRELTITKGQYKLCFCSGEEAGFDCQIQCATPGKKFVEVIICNDIYLVETDTDIDEGILPWVLEEHPHTFSKTKRLPVVFFETGSEQRSRMCGCM